MRATPVKVHPLPSLDVNVAAKQTKLSDNGREFVGLLHTSRHECIHICKSIHTQQQTRTHRGTHTHTHAHRHTQYTHTRTHTHHNTSNHIKSHKITSQQHVSATSSTAQQGPGQSPLPATCASTAPWLPCRPLQHIVHLLFKGPLNVGVCLCARVRALGSGCT